MSSTRATQEAQELLKQILNELENSKGSVASEIQRLLRVATILGDENVKIWCQVQLGDGTYTDALEELLKAGIAAHKNPTDEKAKKALDDGRKKVEEVGIRLDFFDQQEWTFKADAGAGGFGNIGSIEERYADLVRTKRGNDGTHYKNNLHEHLAYVRRVGHQRATALHNRLAYADTPQTSFDVLKRAVDDKLLDIAPNQAEQLMLAFRGVTTDNPEAWSQALTTCRRLIEGLADVLRPPSENPHAGRAVGAEQYINRLWAFMDEAISSESNRELAKAHIDHLGKYLERLHRVSNKGVHSELARIEAVKAVFHAYLVVADILDYVKKESRPATRGRLSINDASLDELESVLGITRDTAKNIVRLRVERGAITLDTLLKVPGIGARAIERAKTSCSFEKDSA